MQSLGDAIWGVVHWVQELPPLVLMFGGFSSGLLVVGMVGYSF